MSKKLLVLGSTSFAGACFVADALEYGHTVYGISRSVEPNEIFLPYGRSSKFRFEQLDLNRDNDEIIRRIHEIKPNFIVDFAGQGMVAPSWQWPEQWYQTNIVAKSKIHNALRALDSLEKYVRVSTPEVYGSTDGLVVESSNYNPSTPYAVSHAAIDMSLMAYHRQFELPVVLTRFANFYGAHQQLYRIVPRAIFCARTSDTLSLHGGGISTRAFIHSSDVSSGLLSTLEKGRLGEIYHFSTEEFVTIRELVEKVALLNNIQFDQFVKVTEDRPAKDAAYFMDITKAKRELNWEATTSLDQGLESANSWIVDNLDIIRQLPHEYIHSP